jgi:hypothetical protein
VADLVVELLAVEDCPHLEQARHDLESILRTGIIEVPIQLVFVTSPDDAEFLGFQGSPTIRINGDDVVPQPELPVALACRVYRDADGRALGSPPIESIRSAIDSHRRDRLEEFQREEAAKVAEFARAADAADLARSSGPVDQAWPADAAQLARATGGADTDKLAREDQAAESSAESEGMPPQG